MIFAGVINGSNLNRDAQLSYINSAIMEAGVEKDFSGELEVTTDSVAAGRAFVEVTRSTLTPNEVFIIPIQATEAETIDTSGSGFVIIKLDTNKIANGSAVADGSDVATIEVVTSLPANNYLVLAELNSGVITDVRNFSKLKDNILGNVATLINAILDASNYKEDCRIMIDTNVDISTDLADGEVIQTLTINEGDRILLTGQTDPSENGGYVAPASGAASRSSDMDESTDFTSAIVPINEGTNQNTTWFCTSVDPVVDTDPINFIQLSTTVTICTQAQAEAGTDNSTVTSPLRVKQAIDFQRPFSNDAEVIAGTNNTKIVTPQGAKAAYGAVHGSSTGVSGAIQTATGSYTYSVPIGVSNCKYYKIAISIGSVETGFSPNAQVATFEIQGKSGGSMFAGQTNHGIINIAALTDPGLNYNHLTVTNNPTSVMRNSLSIDITGIEIVGTDIVVSYTVAGTPSAGQQVQINCWNAQVWN